MLSFILFIVYSAEQLFFLFLNSCLVSIAAQLRLDQQLKNSPSLFQPPLFLLLATIKHFPSHTNFLLPPSQLSA